MNFNNFSKNKFYSLDEIMSVPAQYYVIFGERSNGKTYSVLKYHLNKWYQDGSQLAIVRRWQEDFKGKRGATLYDALIANDEISKATNGEWTGVYYWAGRWFLTKKITNKNGVEETIKSEKPLALGFALSNMEHDKGSSYPEIETIMFDEFITRTTYQNDEFNLFMNVVSTITRHRDTVKVFMLGNTVNKYCPYFKNMGLTNVKQMNPGDIDTYTYGEDGLVVRVEYAEGMKKKDSDVYFGFDNPKLKMITKGAWEIALYPSFPFKYDDNGKKIRLRPADVLLTYFIKFDKELLQCEIVNYCDDVFTFIHRKSTPLQKPDEDLIYDTEYNPKGNYRRRITRPTTDIERKILLFYKTEKVFYQDNEVGEVVRNYMEWCNTEKIN